MTRFLIILFLCTVVSPVSADKNVAIDPVLGKLGSPAVEETFDKPLDKPMIAVKGQWKVVDGVLVGKELAADEHAAVLNYQKKNRNSIVRLSFQFKDKTNGFNFSLNHAKGHLFRVVITPQALVVRLDKDKKDPQSKPINLGNAKASFKKGQWYTLQVEMIGDKVVAQTDNGAIVKASHEKLDTVKPNYRLVMRAESLLIDDLHVWNVK